MMKFLNENIIYEFNVSQDESVSFAPLATDPASEEFTIDFRFRRFHAPSRLPAIELQRHLRLPRAGSENSVVPFMIDVLQEFNVSERTQSDMALHFKFYLDRLSRRGLLRNGIIPVTVSLDVKVIPPERAAEIQSRMEAGRRANNRPVEARAGLAEDAPAPAPAKKSAVEALGREKVRSEEEEKECTICLEGFAVGVEVIRMPCSHIYHKDCILRWLERTHFCPFCRFKLPC